MYGFGKGFFTRARENDFERDERVVYSCLIEIPNAEQLLDKQIQFQPLTDSGRSIDIVLPGTFR